MNTFALVVGLAAVLPASQFAVDITLYECDPFGSVAAGTVVCAAESHARTVSGRPVLARAVGLVSVKQADGRVAREECGTRLEVLPVGYAGGRVWVELNVQQRDLNMGLGAMTAAGFVPGFTEQQSRMAWMAKPGETVRRRIAARSATDQTWVELTVRPVK